MLLGSSFGGLRYLGRFVPFLHSLAPGLLRLLLGLLRLDLFLNSLFSGGVGGRFALLLPLQRRVSLPVLLPLLLRFVGLVRALILFFFLAFRLFAFRPLLFLACRLICWTCGFIVVGFKLRYKICTLCPQSFVDFFVGPLRALGMCMLEDSKHAEIVREHIANSR